MSVTNALKQECAKNLRHKSAQQQGRARVTLHAPRRVTELSCPIHMSLIWRTAVIHYRARELSGVPPAGNKRHWLQCYLAAFRNNAPQPYDCTAVRRVGSPSKLNSVQAKRERKSFKVTWNAFASVSNGYSYETNGNSEPLSWHMCVQQRRIRKLKENWHIPLIWHNCACPLHRMDPPGLQQRFPGIRRPC